MIGHQRSTVTKEIIIYRRLRLAGIALATLIGALFVTAYPHLFN